MLENECLLATIDVDAGLGKFPKNRMIWRTPLVVAGRPRFAEKALQTVHGLVPRLLLFLSRADDRISLLLFTTFIVIFAHQVRNSKRIWFLVLYYSSKHQGHLPEDRRRMREKETLRKWGFFRGQRRPSSLYSARGASPRGFVSPSGPFSDADFLYQIIAPSILCF